MKQHAVYIIDGARTPFLKASGTPGDFHASDLAHAVARIILLRQPFAATDLDEVILGCVSPTPDETNIARVVALRAGCGEKVPAWTVQRNCASGMQALDAAASDIRLGRSGLVLAGGTEAMSHHPLLFSEDFVTWLGQWRSSKNLQQKLAQLGRFRPGLLKPVISLLRGLSDPVTGLSMGQTAEVLAHRFEITRTQMDEYAVRSHQRLDAAHDFLQQEIVPLYNAKGELFDQDNGLRTDSSVEKLARLKPAFDRPFGQVTAGNSAQISDGAALLLLASEQAVETYGLKIKGKLLDCHWAGLSPNEMGLGPVYSMSPLLQRHQLKSADIDYWEINEAFSAQVLACQKAWSDKDFCQSELGLEIPWDPIPDDKLNVDGGGVSIGHPVGASGARIVLHLLNLLKKHNRKRGVSSLCIGGGQGGAMLIENYQDDDHG